MNENIIGSVPVDKARQWVDVLLGIQEIKQMVAEVAENAGLPIPPRPDETPRGIDGARTSDLANQIMADCREGTNDVLTFLFEIRAEMRRLRSQVDR